MTGIYVLTSPRAGDERWPYVRAVVEQAKREEIANPLYMVIDGTEEDAAELADIAPGWMIHRHQRDPGNWIGGNKWPYWRLLEVARETTAPLGDALILEDDLEFAKNALGRMTLFPVPADVHAVQFFSAWLIRTPKAHPGLWRTPASVQGCQAIKFPRRTLEQLVEWKKNDLFQPFNESDVALGVAQAALGLRWSNHMPDLVQHTGAVSAVVTGMLEEAKIDEGIAVEAANASLGGRTSVNYPGPNFDCMKLFARHDLYR
jgi:hypothetical protein